MVVGLGRSGSKKKASKLAEFAHYIPLRLSSDERALLTVLEQTLHVSEYTDNVDVTSARRGIKTRRILDGILEACHIATGLAAVVSGKERSLITSCCSENSTTPDQQEDSKSTPLRKLSFRLTNRKSNKSDKKSSSKKSSKHSSKSMESDTTTSSTTTDGQPSTPSSWVAREPKDNEALFQAMFEISRRNKVLNPTSMRATYGKLMYMLQDAQNPSVAKSLGFSLHKPLILVGPYLEQHGAGALLKDKRLDGATQYITDRHPNTGKRLDRQLVQETVNTKQQLADELVQEYASEKISAENVCRCIESIADAISYVESNVAPVEQMLFYLEEYFDPGDIEGRFSLEISNRRQATLAYNGDTVARYGFSAYNSPSTVSSGGGKLSHSHATQYTFVWQSLQLWCKVMRNMHKLWVCADEDLLSTTSTYHLQNTGQGLNRVQNCPRVRKVMQGLLHQTQQEAGQPWVGLSVIHLGDRDVPNALIFIDKYTQIPRFLNPIVSFLQGLPELCQDKRMAEYATKTFGSQRKLTLTVLSDYFKHGFDGSGDDGGSCIDGRLTSSWNFTSRIAKKPYYNVFMMSGFQGFDGEFK